ncbi:MAG: MarR family transcriptional regulator [Phenylobacterium sp.]|nr:MarR family transcriptional regulator [Phenylobacterium sp.]
MSRVPAAPLSLEMTVTELLQATGQLIRRLRAESNPSELTLSQLAILARLDEVGRMTTADLARAEAMKPQSMGAALASLEQDGLVQRHAHPTDGRQVLFALTEPGVATRRRDTHLKREWLSAAIAELAPGEQQTLVAAVALIKRLSDS